MTGTCMNPGIFLDSICRLSTLPAAEHTVAENVAGTGLGGLVYAWDGIE